LPRYEALFEPVRLGELDLPNRIVLAPMGTGYADQNNAVTDRHLAYHVARARGGVGLNITEHTTPHPAGLTGASMLGIYSDEHIPGFRRLAEAVHDAGGRIAVQINHGGRQASREVIGRAPQAPSSVPCPDGSPAHEMSLAEIEEIVEAYAQGVRRAAEAGCDGVEIHMAHGYLGASFLSPHTNRRTDEYGGDTRRRTRFAQRLIERARQLVGEDFPIWCRISAEEYVEDGLHLDEALRLAPLLESYGYCALSVSVCLGETAIHAAHPYYGRQGYQVENAAAVKGVVGVPVITVGKLWEPAFCDRVIAQGKADLIALGRSLLADPEWPNKALQGREDDIRPCIFCNLGCLDRRASPEGHTICLTNPATGREAEFELRPAPERRRVVVVGGGPAGLEAARVAALRGHEVILLEARDALGGQFRLATVPPGKADLLRYLEWLIRQVGQLDLHVKLNTEVTADDVLALSPAAVILAQGSTPREPPQELWGDGSLHLVAADDVLAGRAVVQGQVAIVGGDWTGPETAHFLAERGCRVTIVEEHDRLGQDMVSAPRAFLRERLDDLRVEVFVETRAKQVLQGALVLETPEGPWSLRNLNAVVLAIGRRPRDTMSASLREAGIEVHTAGDMNAPRTALEAVLEGARAARLV